MQTASLHGIAPPRGTVLFDAHLASNAVTALSYLAIAATLALLVRRLKGDLPFGPIFLLFGAFIVLCGGTHFFGLLTLWWPLHSLSVTVSVLTALVSALTAVVLWQSMPQISAFVHDAKQARERERAHARAEALADSNVKLEAQAAALTAMLQERDALAAQLRQSQKMEVMGRLASGVAHDFNNLLTIMQANLELVLPSVAGLPEAAMLGDVHDAAVSAGQLTKRLLAFGRWDRNARTITDLDHLIGDGERLYRGALPSAITLEMRSTSNGATVQVNPTQLQQAVLNLVVNARDALGASGRITIVTGRASVQNALPPTSPPIGIGSYATVSVQDTGTGMDSTTMSRIFEPFFTTKPEGHGTGLGLAMVYDAAVQHGGGVAVQTTLGKGSAFTLYLPLAA